MQTIHNTKLTDLYPDEAVDAKVAARLLGLSVRTVQDMAARRQLPVYKIGRAVRFVVSELLEWRETKRLH